VVVLLIILRKKVGNLGGKRIAGSYWKIMLSTIIMGGIIYAVWKYISVYAYSSLLWLIVSMVGIIILGAGIYIALTVVLKMDEVRFVINMLGGLKDRFSRNGRNDDR
jgi:putative peptidoglycan lipid II flippase